MKVKHFVYKKAEEENSTYMDAGDDLTFIWPRKNIEGNMMNWEAFSTEQAEGNRSSIQKHIPHARVQLSIRSNGLFG